MKKIILTATLFLVSLLILSNCNSITDSKENSAKLAVYLTDAAASYDSVVIVFSEISAHIDSQWVHVTQEQRRVNLLEWSNGETLLLGSADVPAGKYTQVRVKIDSAFIGVEGNVYEMKVPSGAQTGLKLRPQFTIAEGSDYELVLDFDADKSVVVHGPKHNPHSYSLKPHIRMIAHAVSGSISGIVTNPEHLPLARAIIGHDTVTTSIVDTTTGFFQLAFLPDSIYSVAITNTMDQSYSAESVEVNAGQNNNLGQITLQ
ncbi:MAG TPA: DUF4382 domain-containing protein [Ignavibacteriaceae bacterium]|nr:DUF4382 domain-containing protein [Ignavibacteriaceae bacterium]